MPSIHWSVGIEVYKLSISHEKSTLSNLRNSVKVMKKSQSFTYVVRQGTIVFNKFTIRQLIRWFGLSEPYIIGLAFRSFG